VVLVIFACKVLENYRNKSFLPLLDDLFLKFLIKIEKKKKKKKSLDVSLDLEKDYDNHNSYYFI